MALGLAVLAELFVEHRPLLFTRLQDLNELPDDVDIICMEMLRCEIKEIIDLP